MVIQCKTVVEMGYFLKNVNLLPRILNFSVHVIQGTDFSSTFIITPSNFSYIHSALDSHVLPLEFGLARNVNHIFIKCFKMHKMFTNKPFSA